MLSALIALFYPYNNLEGKYQKLSLWTSGSLSVEF